MQEEKPTTLLTIYPDKDTKGPCQFLLIAVETGEVLCAVTAIDGEDALQRMVQSRKARELLEGRFGSFLFAWPDNLIVSVEELMRRNKEWVDKQTK